MTVNARMPCPNGGTAVRLRAAVMTGMMMMERYMVQPYVHFVEHETRRKRGGYPLLARVSQGK